jgi:hypothetical protein
MNTLIPILSFGMILVAVVMGIPTLIGMWKVFAKAGQPGWAVLIPVYNFIILLRIAGLRWYWVFTLLIVPIPILLIISGALLLVAGSVVYLTPGLVAPIVPDEDGKAVAIKLLKEAAPRGESYPATPRASLEDNIQDWPTPEENDDNWDYDLFTTIEVVWDSAIKEYVPRSRKVEELPPFGVALVSAGHPTYTFMLVQSTLAPGKKEEDRLFTLKNVKKIGRAHV